MHIINKDAAVRKIRTEVKARNHFRTADVYHFAGTGEKDMKPIWSKVGSPDVSDNILEGVEVPGTSITVLDIRTGD